MIKDNVNVVINRLGNVNNSCGDLIHYLNKLKNTEKIVELTTEQKTTIISGVNSYALIIKNAYDSLALSFIATEFIEE